MNFYVARILINKSISENTSNLYLKHVQIIYFEYNEKLVFKKLCHFLNHFLFL